MMVEDSKNKKLEEDVEGFEYVTNALMELVSEFPGLSLEYNEEFFFQSVPDGEGLSIIPTSGAVIYESRESITGHVRQMCEYPFTVIYKASGLNQRRKIQVKEWLDTLGRWLTKQPVKIDEETYTLTEWPDLTHGRVIRTIERQSTAFLAGIDEDKCEVWSMDMTLRYRNEFYR